LSVITSTEETALMSDLLVVRHAESTWNAEHRWAGWGDPPLSEEGKTRVRAVLAELAHLGLGAVVCSDLLRARRTGEIIAGGLGLGPPTLLSALRERNAGSFTGKTSEEIAAGWPELFERWRAGQPVDPPGSEPRESFIERVLAGLVEAAGQVASTAIVVTHQGVIRVIQRHLGSPVPPLRNLEGLWVSVESSTMSAGQSFSPTGREMV
jgi:probable phosphoglycerate mutase